MKVKNNPENRTSFSYIKRPYQDFCEGCSFLGLYNKSKDSCILCESEAMNEDQIAKNKFGDKYSFHEYIGYYNALISAISKKYQAKSSAGGLLSAVNQMLLNNQLIDYVLAVGYCQETQTFRYFPFRTVEELIHSQRSAYYPVNLAEAIDIIKTNEGTAAITAIPSAAKAIEILKMQDPEVARKIKFVLGLVSGHVKTAAYTDYLCKMAGKVDGIDLATYVSYRDKAPLGRYTGGDYYFVVRDSQQEWRLKASRVKHNWLGGLFKEFSSDFCDDVFCETADIVVMDGWLPKYQSSKGVSLAIVRNYELLNLIRQSNDLIVENVPPTEIIKSQWSGLLHKNKGLSVRLAFYKLFGNKIPVKRVKPKFGLDLYYVLIQGLRLFTSIRSNRIYEKHGNPQVFEKKMRLPLLILFYLNLGYSLPRLIRKRIEK